MLRDLYETELGIYDHFSYEAKQRPLASVAFHPIEDFNDGSGLQVAMKLYVDRNIHELFGLSFTEFISLPRDIGVMMNDIALDNIIKKSKVMKDMEQELTYNNPKKK